jgi:hypothetical protein
MSEPEPAMCSCRDRDTRVLRAIIAAASHLDTFDTQPSDPGTDLLLPKIGSSGNRLERLVHLLVQEGIVPGDLLMAAWMTLPGVPMAAQALDEVHAFVAGVDATVHAAHLGRELARRVHDAVLEHEELERRIHDDIQRMRDREADQRAKEEGTYWRERDGRRTARRSTHVLVDPDAWIAMRREAHLRSTTVGELVAEWVREMTVDVARSEKRKLPDMVSRRPERDGKGRLDHIACRLAIEPADWGRAKSNAVSLQVTTARYVGLAVEGKVASLPKSPRWDERPGTGWARNGARRGRRYED